ncbi:hypothetical protein [Gloeothece verrucosa]|uniref:PEP-CTERM protein-sorting domain-containing protein n=1 Tax=Gloeothece verrucosa (strain PCC 7822) TaxID=497965 RepID=E0UGS7_GLOV7|nr:hypothetical protein [Gloeothece verrucosa]ADN14408.1 hypothetical protein Cyan7822_2433 [Gloeothece verrucosa PCC 7822]
MLQISRKIAVFGLAIMGLSITPVAAKSLTLQETNQSAMVVGTDNQVKQEVNQVLSNYFAINYDLNSQNFQIISLPEIDNNLRIKQSSKQETFISGSQNKVIQKNQQIQINYFNISLLNLPKNNSKNSNFILHFLDNISDISENNKPIITEQLSSQKVFIDGEENQVTQQVNQIVMGIFYLNTESYFTPSITEIVQESFSQSLNLGKSNQITQELKQTWLDLFLFGTEGGRDSLSLDELIQSASEADLFSEIELLMNEKNLFPYSYRGQTSYFSRAELPPTVSVPEPSSVINLLAVGIIGITVKIYQNFKP